MSYSLARKCGIVPIEAGVALSRGQLVKISGETVVVCTAADEPYGAVTEDFAAGDIASVALIGGTGGTVYLLADGPSIVTGNKLKPAAAGRVASGGALGSETGLLVALSTESAGAQGELIECALLTPVTVA